MTRRRRGVAGAGVGLAALAVASPASAWEPGGYLNPGVVASTVWAQDNRGAYGFELSYTYYPGRGQEDWFNFGPLSQWLWYTDGSKRFMAGGQAAWGGIGLELGWAYRFGADYAAQHTIHLAPYLSAGLLTMALRVGIPVHAGSDAEPTHGGELGLLFGFKFPVPINGDPPPRFSSVSGARGRPLRVRGEARVAKALTCRGPRAAPRRAGQGWASHEGAARPDVTRLSHAERAELARTWRRDALLEHASVGAFAALALRLLAVGAPAALVERAQRASLEEVEHARLCFDLASAYAGRSIRPGPLDAGGLGAAGDLDALAVETLVDGCLGEGVAAAEARACLKSAIDPTVRRVLTRVARDEARHAALAWDVLGFALDRGAAPAVARALGQLPAARPAGRPRRDEAVLAAHGRLPPGRLADVQRRVRDRVVERATALLQAPRPRRR